jgi:DNA gyrase subunit A
VRKGGLIAVSLKEDDELIMVRPIEDDAHVALATAGGYAIRFACGDVRPMGRVAAGVKGIALRRGDSVVAGLILRPDDQSTAILSISALGYGKRTQVGLYRLQSRGGIGVKTFKITPKTGPVVGGMPVHEDDALILLTSTNKIIRMALDQVRSIGRVTSGVLLVRLDEGARVVGFDRLALDESSRLAEDVPGDNM